MNFVEQPFEITVYNSGMKDTSKVEVKGTVAEGTGLGYYVDKDEEAYVVTHLESGFNLGFYLYDETHVQTWIEAIAPLWDWHISAKAIYVIPRETKRQVGKALDRITDNYLWLGEVTSEEIIRESKRYAGIEE